MGEVDEHLEALADDLVTFFAADIGDESHATGIMFILRMIESLRPRIAGATIHDFHGSLCEQRWGAVIL
jgi:hypothetical protein